MLVLRGARVSFLLSASLCRTCFPGGLLALPLCGAAPTFLCLPKKSRQKKGASFGGQQRMFLFAALPALRLHFSGSSLFTDQ
jgi:hypothetical protein